LIHVIHKKIYKVLSKSSSFHPCWSRTRTGLEKQSFL